MDKQQRENFPDVLKTITLDNADRLRYKRQFRLSQRVRHRLSEITRSMMEEELVLEDEGWDEIAKKFGFDDREALHDAGYVIEASWITGKMTLRGKKEAPKGDQNDEGLPLQEDRAGTASGEETA